MKLEKLIYEGNKIFIPPKVDRAQLRIYANFFEIK